MPESQNPCVNLTVAVLHVQMPQADGPEGVVPLAAAMPDRVRLLSPAIQYLLI